jgi:hypothetical protein
MTETVWNLGDGSAYDWMAATPGMEVSCRRGHEAVVDSAAAHQYRYPEGRRWTQALTATFVKVASLGPTLSGVDFGSSSFVARTGTTLRMTVSEPATVSVVVTQQVHGRKVKGRCRAKATNGKRCTLIVQKAKLTFKAVKGRNSFKFRIRSLRPGRYTATITAGDAAGRTSTKVTLTFTIKAPKKTKHK